MKFLLLILLSGMAFAAGPECQRACEPEGTPTVPEVLRDIREHVTGECTEVSEIVVTPPQPDDPCTLANLDGSLYHDSDGGDLSWMADVDKSYATTGKCRGEVINNLCYLRTNNLYAPGGAARWTRDSDGNYLLQLKQSQECRDHRNNSCTIPYERASLDIAVSPEDIFDNQNKEDTIVPCHPRNCYSITLATNYYRTPGGYKIPIFQMVTVTREADGSLRSRAYVNGPVHTSQVTSTGLVGEGDVRRDLLGRRDSEFVSCTVPFSERRRSYFPK